jgi:hypothetical protein
MRGSVHIVGSPRCVASTFEPNPPQPNPPKEVYYRRAVYQMALARLQEILKAIEAHEGHATGKAFRNEHGDVVGRGKGILPSLRREFPEVPEWKEGPAHLARTIRQAKSADYFDLLQAAVHQVESRDGEQLELFIKAAPRAQLDEIPPVMYPAHKGTARCRHCRSPHASALHRFHLRGAFDNTHPGPGRAEIRKKERERERERWQDEEVPF